MTGTEQEPTNDGEGSPTPAAESRRPRPGRRGFPNWVLPTSGALALGLLIGLTVADRSTDAPAGPSLPQVVAEAPRSSAAVALSLPDAPAAEAPVDTTTTPARSEPVQLEIPAIELTSPLVGLGLNDDRTLEVPVDFSKAGWFTSGSYPGDPQGPPAIIAGHVDDYTGPAVFARLGELTENAEVIVVRADNSAAVFRVTEMQRFPKDAFPAEQLYAPVPASELVLITCTGGFDQEARSYTENLVVRARLDVERSREVSQLRVDHQLVAPEGDLPNVA